MSIESKSTAQPTAPVERMVRCPTCKTEHIKALYDWQYIHCNDCKTYFEKHTGKFIKQDGDPQSLPKDYWKTDLELGI